MSMDLILIAVLFISALVAFTVVEIVFVRPIVGPEDPRDKGTKELTLWIPAVGIGLTCYSFTQMPENPELGIINYIGFVCAGIGLTIRVLAKRKLGKFFTIGITVFKHHELIKDGIYKYIRNPGDLGFLLFYIGLPLVIKSWLGVIALTLPSILVFLYRIKVEEKALTETFGDEYLNYVKKSFRLIPFVW